VIKLPIEKCVGHINDYRPVPYPAPGCKDVSSDCSARAISEQCDTSPDMLTRCQRSCGLCRLVSSVPGCVDRDASCLVASSVQGRCQRDAVGMGPQGMSCLLSCDICKAAPPRWGRTHALHDTAIVPRQPKADSMQLRVLVSRICHMRMGGVNSCYTACKCSSSCKAATHIVISGRWR
jgi:hypothetical protein